ncbi:hypothetical protein ACRRTK_012220 [Alexandromys fortis]
MRGPREALGVCPKSFSFLYRQYFIHNFSSDLIVFILLKLPFTMSIYTYSLRLKQRDAMSVPVPVPDGDYRRQSLWCFLDNGCYNKSMKGEYRRIIVNDVVFLKGLV